MKTLTEFSGFVLKEAVTKKAALATEGKSEEEIEARVNELLKLDEAKVGFYKNVVDMTSSRVDRVKRVVVAVKASETEKVPENYIEREGHFYLVEYFPEAGRAPARGGRDDRDFRSGRGGGREGRGGGRDGGGRDGGGRDGRGSGRDRPRSEVRDAAPSAPRNPGAPGFVSTGLGVATKPARPPREKRAPKPRGEPKPRSGEPRAPRGPKGAGELRLVLKGQNATTLQGSAPIEAVAQTSVSTEAQTDSAQTS
ncbi:MAG: hypothetical protein KGP28_10755 [Bdellovibrionales bacterium]|nr:hypothetical protein [Bdellovibrionales bacterium]